MRSFVVGYRIIFSHNRLGHGSLDLVNKACQKAYQPRNQRKGNYHGSGRLHLKGGKIVRIDEERIKGHLGEIGRGSVEETLNALPDAGADRLCRPGATSEPGRGVTPVQVSQQYGADRGCGIRPKVPKPATGTFGGVLCRLPTAVSPVPASSFGRRRVSMSRPCGKRASAGIF